MAWNWFRRGVIVPYMLSLGALTVAWNIALTMLLSSDLPQQQASEESVLLSNQTHQYEREERQGKNYTEMQTLRLDSSVIGNFPRIINIDGGSPSSEHVSEKNRRVHVDRHTLQALALIEDDKNYLPDQDSPSQEECVPMSLWQSHSYPNCNSLHELDLYYAHRDGELDHVASGGSNDVFRVHSGQNSSLALHPDLIVKMLSPSKKHLPGIPHTSAYSEHNFDIVRRDALVAEQLTRSSHVQPLFGYCGFSMVIPYADGGTLAKLLGSEYGQKFVGWKSLTPLTRLKYAVDAANGLADVHNIGVVHADLTVRQYMIRNETLELGDFNRGIFLRRNATAPDTPCTFLMTDNYGVTRAPEEYMHNPQTSAVDVWSLGSILHQLLTGRKVWDRQRKNKAQEAVIQGMRPEISNSILNSSDPVDKVLMKALDKCYIYDASQRPSAREIASLLQQEWEDLLDT